MAQPTPGGVCDFMNPFGDCPLSSPGEMIADAAGNAFESMARSMAEAAEQLMVSVTSAWTSVPSTNPTYNLVSAELTEDLRWVTALVAGLALIYSAARFAWTQRADDAREIAAGLIRQVLVGAAGMTVLYTSLRLGDRFSEWIINESTDGTFNAETLLTGASAWAMAPGLIFILGLIGVIVGLLEIAMLVFRNGLVVVLGASWQIGAAASTTPAGKEMFNKITGWLAAFVLYKPAAAICYAGAYRLLLTDQAEGGDAVLAAATGITLLVAAVLAMPAMIRLVVPLAGSIGGVSGGAVMAAGATVATGAVALAAGGGAAGAGGASGAAPSTGASGSTGPSSLPPGGDGSAGSLSPGPGTGDALPPGDRPGGELPPGPRGPTPIGDKGPIAAPPAGEGQGGGAEGARPGGASTGAPREGSGGRRMVDGAATAQLMGQGVSAVGGTARGAMGDTDDDST